MRFHWKYCASSQSPSSTWSHALWGSRWKYEAETSATVRSPILPGAMNHRGQLLNTRWRASSMIGSLGPRLLESHMSGA